MLLCPPGFNLLQVFSDFVGPIDGQLIVPMCPCFLFIMVVIIIYLFVLADSLISKFRNSCSLFFYHLGCWSRYVFLIVFIS